MSMPYYYVHPFMGFGIGLLWLIVIIVIAYLVYRLIRDGKILAPTSRPAIKSAEDILAERYAKGEVTRDQYQQIKNDIKKST
jgi:putative membrane protein